MKRFFGRVSIPRQNGSGLVVCDRSGAQTPASEIVDDVRGGRVRRQSADITPGFGTYHPQDVREHKDLDDPKPIVNARPAPLPMTLREQGITDDDVRQSVVTGTPLGS